VLEFSYRLTGFGWSEARIADATGEATVTASYLSDALRDLVDAVCVITEGKLESRCSWDEEPGEYRWIFNRDSNAARLKILVFDELWSDKPDTEGRLIYTTEQPILRLARLVLSECQRLLNDLGEDGYHREWGAHPWPTTSIDRLRLAIEAAS
jgi:hypothetical protein